MKKIFSVLTLLFAFNGFAQDQDPKAKAILDDLSKTTKSYKTISAEYELVLLNKEKKQTDKQSGKIQVKGNKFKLEIPGNTIVCDGKTVWTHNKDAQEVTIKNFEANNEDGLIQNAPWAHVPTSYKDATTRNFCICCSMFSKTSWQKINGYDENRVLIGREDWDFWIRLYQSGCQVHVIEDYLLLYRIHGDSLSLGSGTKMKDAGNYLRSKHPI